MPARDGTGPWGRGPMTGRGMGFCSTGTFAGAAPRGFGGRGRRFGCAYGFNAGADFGAGWRRLGRWGVGVPSSPASEGNLEEMKQVARNLESELEAVRVRIAALEKE